MDPRPPNPPNATPATRDGTDATHQHPAAARPAGGLPFLSPPQQLGELGRLGPYRVLAELGRGGMGVVFLAEETALKRRVALKVMLPEVAADPKANARFRREAEAQAAVEHDHIIAIHRVDEANGVPFIAMPLLRGQTLASALRLNPRPPLAELVRIGREMAEGLAAAHAVGLVHRDIKPGNVWLEGSKRRVKILDFGLARTSGAAQRADDPVTDSRAIVGTPAYMSPEQARSQPVDFRTDLFSLGVALYQMATGKTPFTGSNPFDLLSAVVAHDPPPVSALCPDVPPALSELVRWLLAKNPLDRPPGAAAVADELERIERGLIAPPVVVVSLPDVPSVPDPWTDIATTYGESAVPTDAPHTDTPEAARPVRVPRWTWAVAAGLLAVAAGAVWVAATPQQKAADAVAPDKERKDEKKDDKKDRKDEKKDRDEKKDKDVPPALTHRDVAVWALKQQGERRHTHVGVRRLGVDKSDSVYKAEALPPGPFTITGVCLDGLLPEHAGDLWAMFGALGDLDLLQFNGPAWTDERLATAIGALNGRSVVTLEIWKVTGPLPKATVALGGLKAVKSLYLTTTVADGIPLKAVGEIRGVSNLKLGTELTDAALTPISAMRAWPRNFDLRGNAKLTDAGIAHIRPDTPGRAGTRIEFDLSETGVTAAGVAALTERLPEATVKWNGGTAGPFRLIRQREATQKLIARGARIEARPPGRVLTKAADLSQDASIISIDLVSGAGTAALAPPENGWYGAGISTSVAQQLTDADLEPLRHLPTDVLRLHGQKLTDAGAAKFFASLPANSARSLFITNCDVGDETARAVAGWSELVTLVLNDTKVTDAGVKAVAELRPPLAELRLANTAVTDEAVPALARLKLLVALDLKGTKVSATGAEALRAALPYTWIRTDETTLKPTRARLTRDAALAKLTARGAQVRVNGNPVVGAVQLGATPSAVQLTLRSGRYHDQRQPENGWEAEANGTVAEPFDDDDLATLAADLRVGEYQFIALNRQKVTDAGIAALVALPSVRAVGTIELIDCEAGDEAARHLATLPKLKRLCLNRTRVGNDGVRHLLARVDTLESLRLAHTRVTDGAIDDLARFKLLTELDLAGTAVTTDGAKRLAAALPKCRIRTANGTVLGPPLPPGLVFDGKSTFVRVPALNFDGRLPLTIEAWITPETLQTDGEQYICLLGEPGGGIGIASGGRPAVGVYLGDNRWERLHSRELLTAGKTVHVAAVLTAEGITLFVNGKEVGTHAVKLAGLPSTKAPVVIGRGTANAGNSGYFHGTMHGLRISRSARYAAPITPPTVFDVDADALAVYQFRQSAGKALTDSTKAGLHGDIESGTWVAPK
jgi:serine/threonine protein kinase